MYRDWYFRLFPHISLFSGFGPNEGRCCRIEGHLVSNPQRTDRTAVHVVCEFDAEPVEACYTCFEMVYERGFVTLLTVTCFQVAVESTVIT